MSQHIVRMLHVLANLHLGMTYLSFGAAEIANIDVVKADGRVAYG